MGVARLPSSPSLEASNPPVSLPAKMWLRISTPAAPTHISMRSPPGPSFPLPRPELRSGGQRVSPGADQVGGERRGKGREARPWQGTRLPRLGACCPLLPSCCRAAGSPPACERRPPGAVLGAVTARPGRAQFLLVGEKAG